MIFRIARQIRRRFKTRYFVTTLIIFTLYHTSKAFDPIALHQLIEVELGGEIVISLLAHALKKDKTITTITSLPTTGNLYQLSYVYNIHGYDPKRGKPITSVPTNVTGSDSRLVYARPSNDRFHGGEWDRFKYTVTSLSSKYTSHPGTIVLVNPTINGLLASSMFTTSDEGWHVHTSLYNRNNRTLSVIHDQTSRGAEMNQFIYATDNSINRDFAHAIDHDIWAFVSPSKFHGWQGIAYDGSLEFTLSSYSGSFEPSNYNKLYNGNDLNLVEIFCSKCKLNTGLTLAFPLLKTASGLFNGLTTQFSLSLNEKAGWVKDPKNELIKNWQQPTKCEFIEVLCGITNMKIIGDFTKWYESITLDNVNLRAANSSKNYNGRYQMPICAQNRPDGRKCTCNN